MAQQAVLKKIENNREITWEIPICGTAVKRTGKRLYTKEARTFVIFDEICHHETGGDTND